MKAKVLQIVWHDKLPVFSADFHPTLEKVATAGGDNYIRIWRILPLSSQDGASGQLELLANLNRHTKSVNVVRFSPNGEFLASAGDDGSIILWKFNDLSSLSESKRTGNLTDENELESKETWVISGMLRSHAEDIYDLAWSPDSSMLLTGSIDNVIRLWDVKKMRLLQEMNEHSHYVQGVAWDPLGRFIASQSSDRSLRVFELRTRKNGNLTNVCIARNQKFDFLDINSTKNSGSKDPIEIPETDSQQTINESKLPPVKKLFHNENLASFFRRLTFTPDGALLLTGAGLFHDVQSDKTAHALYIYARSNFSRPIACIAGFKKPVVSIRCSPIFYKLRSPKIKQSLQNGPCEDKLIATQPETDVEAEMLLPCSPPPSKASKSDDTTQQPISFICLPYRMIYAVATLDTLRVYDTQQIEPLATLSNFHYAALTDIAWSQDGQSLLVTSCDGFCTFVTFSQDELGVSLEDSVARALINTTYKEPVPTSLLRSLRKRKVDIKEAASIIENSIENSIIEKDEENEDLPSFLETDEKYNDTLIASMLTPTSVDSTASMTTTSTRKRIIPTLVSPLPSSSIL